MLSRIFERYMLITIDEEGDASSLFISGPKHEARRVAKESIRGSVERQVPDLFGERLWAPFALYHRDLDEIAVIYDVSIVVYEEPGGCLGWEKVDEKACYDIVLSTVSAMLKDWHPDLHSRLLDTDPDASGVRWLE